VKPFAILISGVLLLCAADLALIEPSELSTHLAAKPVIFHVGPNVLYRSKHIAGAIYAGVGSKEEGLGALKKAAADLPRDREIVIYCGCCPWDKCPNVHPALEALRQMGFTKVRALHLPDNFKTNWIDQGYPVQ